MAKIKALSEEKNFSMSAPKVESEEIPCTSAFNCPVTTAIEVIGGKWKVIILYQLRGKTVRFGELKKRIPKITQKMLTQQLRELERDKLVKRVVYAEVPPRVEYSPTSLADKLNPVLDSLCDWGKNFRQRHVKST
jgi:DNA-binding HxlR family transcriptional regulator